MPHWEIHPGGSVCVCVFVPSGLEPIDERSSVAGVAPKRVVEASTTCIGKNFCHLSLVQDYL